MTKGINKSTLLMNTPKIIRFLINGNRAVKKLPQIVTKSSSTLTASKRRILYLWSKFKGWSDLIVACLIFLWCTVNFSSIWVWFKSSSTKLCTLLFFVIIYNFRG